MELFEALDKTLLAEGDITVLLSVYSGVSALILLMAVLYYPSKPPSPPSHTAAGNIYLSIYLLVSCKIYLCSNNNSYI